MKSLLLFFCLSFCFLFQTLSQPIWPGSYEYYVHNLEIASLDTVEEISRHLSSFYQIDFEESFSLLDINSISYFNSNYPRSWNDGPVWVGKGITQEIRGGFSIFSKHVFLTFAPTVYFSQNRSYDLAEINALKNTNNYQFRKMAGSSADIDFVQRYGNDSFFKFHLGQSSLDFKFGSFVTGISTQNFTLGPARVNHLIMSNGGAGFPFIHFGTNDKINIKIKDLDLGHIEPFLYYGLLRESEYFDDNNTNNSRYINGLSIGYEPPRLNGVTLGFSRVMYTNTELFKAADLFSLLYIVDDDVKLNSKGDTIRYTGNDTFDQLASLFLQWKLVKSQARFYLEYGKNDFDGGFRKTALEFEHNSLFTFGIEKIWKGANQKRYSILYEHTQLTFYKNYIYRLTNSAYTHTVNKQGYTHQGQLLGPGIGPGSISNYLGIKMFQNEWYMGMSLQRVKFDEDYFLTQIPNIPDKKFQHDIEYSLGLDLMKQKGKIGWGIQTLISYRFNTYFISYNDMTNLNLQFSLTYNLAD
ncbi:MAG: hypothetical protein ACJA0X_001082 [Cyclobacteriaceae bacterium]|jgi:hypothetical protein